MIYFIRGELLTLGDIENIYKKKKTTKEERILSVRVGFFFYYSDL